ncbi:MAG TPA: SDR family oxidoreductase [Candidatus Saccharimonadales bacterium]|nr:SDR family oxidoreductase [Candidatus Saccharimonadales bacterium]
MTDLNGKVVLVTGSSSGIGQAIAIRFAREGAKVIINYRANKEGGEETLARIKEITNDCMLVQADVSKEEDVKRLFKATLDKFGTVDVLINNAAIGTDKRPFMEATYEDFQEMIDADITSVFMCSQQAAIVMQKQGHGKILNTSSVRGWEGGGRAPVYAAMKAAVNSFTKTFAKMVAPAIQVNAVGPGFVKTRSYDVMAPEMIKGFIESTYLKRWVTSEEIADAFVFLAKNDAMTGQVIYVDAGFTLK